MTLRTAADPTDPAYGWREGGRLAETGASNNSGLSCQRDTAQSTGLGSDEGETILRANGGDCSTKKAHTRYREKGAAKTPSDSPPPRFNTNSPCRLPPPQKPPRSHSLEMLEEEADAGSYIGDLAALEELRRAAAATRETGVVRTKSVTIHPDVTEFHYPGADATHMVFKHFC